MLYSKKIFLRRFEEGDLKYKVKWVNDAENNKTLLFDYPISLSETKEWFKKTFFNRSRWDFVIIEKRSKNIIGMTGLINVNLRHRNAQFFITIGEKKFKGKGLSKIAINLVLEFAFNELGLQKIYLLTLANNTLARRIYENIGFKQEAFFKKEYNIHGDLKDIYRHALLKEDFSVFKK